MTMKAMDWISGTSSVLKMKEMAPYQKICAEASAIIALKRRKVWKDRRKRLMEQFLLSSSSWCNVEIKLWLFVLLILKIV